MQQRAANLIGTALAMTVAACGPGAQTRSRTGGPSAAIAEGMVPVTITSATGKHHFLVEAARGEEEQRRGLMFRTDIPANGGMLFAPYPPSGPPRDASFWMKDTPTPLDIVFIRPDRTIARIAENTPPESEIPVASGEPVGAVLELRGGRSLDLGIKEGDTVSWTDPSER